VAPRSGQPTLPASSRPASLTPPAFGFIVILVSAIVWVYATSFAGVFLIDDVRSIAQNPNIRSLTPLTRAMSAPEEVTVSGRPVASLTLAINYALAPADARDVFAPDLTGAHRETTERFLRNVWGYHAVNLGIHILAALTLFGIVRRTLASPSFTSIDELDARWLAFGVALIWAVHPLQTESVTYIVQRVESLAGLFILLTLYCAIRAGEADRRMFWTAAAVASCALAMASKAVAVGAPVIVLLWDRIFAPARSGSGLRRRVPLYAGLAATWIVLVAVVVEAPRHASVGLGLRDWTAWTYLLTQCGVIVHYLRLAIVPAPLVLLYDWPRVTAIGAVAPQAALLVALAIASVWGVVRRHPAGFAGACFFLILAPTSSVLPIVTEIAAEHRMYLPLAAVVALTLVGGYTLAIDLSGRRGGVHRRGRIVLAAATAGLATWYGVQTRARNLDYTSDEGMWRNILATEPHNPRAHTGYGIALLREGHYASAESELRESVRLEPGNALSQANLGAALLGEHRLDEAISYLEQSLAIQPASIDAVHNLAQAFAAQGRFASAAVAEARAAAIARSQGLADQAADFERRAAAFRALVRGPE